MVAALVNIMIIVIIILKQPSFFETDSSLFQALVTTELEGGDRQRAMKRLRVPPLGAAQVAPTNTHPNNIPITILPLNQQWQILELGFCLDFFN